MNDNMCEKCKYKGAPASIPPCVICKYTFSRGTKEFDYCENLFTPAGGESKKAEPEEVKRWHDMENDNNIREAAKHRGGNWKVLIKLV